MVSVLVPRGGRCPHRARAWRWVRSRYASAHPDWSLVEARPRTAGAWCKAAAVNPAIAASEAEILVVADADVWTEGLPAAVAAVQDGEAAWAVPHGFVHRMSAEGTAAILSGADWRSQEPLEEPHWGIEGGGILVARREALLSAPLDYRFVSWGQEDECQAMALRTLVGEPWRGEAGLLHLWHPPQERYTRRRGSRESWELRSRYRAAAENPVAMAAMIEEGRCSRR